MIIIYNRLIPFKGFKAINLFEIIFVRKDCHFSGEDYIHEAVHTEQMRELLYIGFYLWYLIEWVIRLIIDHKTAYRNLSFEREARDVAGGRTWDRKPFGWLRYYKKNN